jgi:hypothetical protein
MASKPGRFERRGGAAGVCDPAANAVIMSETDFKAFQKRKTATQVSVCFRALKSVGHTTQ